MLVCVRVLCAGGRLAPVACVGGVASVCVPVCSHQALCVIADVQGGPPSVALGSCWGFIQSAAQPHPWGRSQEKGRVFRFLCGKWAVTPGATCCSPSACRPPPGPLLPGPVSES